MDGKKFFARPFLQKFNLLDPVWLNALLIGCGILLRARRFLENRSFWLDEVCAALMIVGRSWDAVIRQVPISGEFPQMPLFFVLPIKALAAVLGNQEMVLRAFPFLCSIAVLFLFYALCRRLLAPAAVPIALALFAFNEYLIYFSAELKPYASDVLCAAILYLAAENYLCSSRSLRKGLVLAGAGHFLMWLSFPAVFILAGVGLVMIVIDARSGIRRFLKYDLLMILTWIAGFALFYQLVFKDQFVGRALLSSWQNSFPPQAGVTETLAWFGWALKNLVRNPLGLRFPPVIGIFMLIGTWTLAGKQRGAMTGVLWAAWIMVILAALFHKYPFLERVILFLVPSAVIFIAGGIYACWRTFPGRLKYLFVFAIVLTLVPPVKNGLTRTEHWMKRQNNREAMAFLCREFEPGDQLVLNNEGQYPYWYYGQRFNCARETDQGVPLPPQGAQAEGTFGYKVGQVYDKLMDYQGRPFLLYREVIYRYDEYGHFQELLTGGSFSQERPIFQPTPLDFIGNKRTWFFFSSMEPAAEQFLFRKMQQEGNVQAKFQGKGAAVYLIQ